MIKYALLGMGYVVREIMDKNVLKYIDFYVDNDQTVIGSFFLDKEIISPDALKNIMPPLSGKIIITSYKYRFEMISQLEKYGYTDDDIMFAFDFDRIIINGQKGLSLFPVSDWITKEKNEDYQLDDYAIRVRMMYEMIDRSNVHSILDLGAGKQLLKHFIKGDMDYFPVDYLERIDDGKTEICDFNKGEFPDRSVDCVFVSGVIEYVKDYRWFLKQIAGVCKSSLIISYYDNFSYTGEVYKRTLDGVNCVAPPELILIVQQQGFVLKVIKHYRLNTWLFRFDKEEIHE